MLKIADDYGTSIVIENREEFDDFFEDCFNDLVWIQKNLIPIPTEHNTKDFDFDKPLPWFFFIKRETDSEDAKCYEVDRHFILSAYRSKITELLKYSDDYARFLRM